MNSTTNNEHIIDEALQTMREAQPPDGMQQRILRRAQQIPVKRMFFSRPSFWKLASAGCCAVLIAITAIDHWNDSVERDEAAHVLPLRVAELAPARPVRSIKAAPHGIPNAGPRAYLTFASARRRGPLASTARKDASDGSAYAEMFAPSKPAPEMPLTQQERLLLAAAHRRDESTQVASLRRPVWPLHDPEDDDNFEQFFQRPTSNTTETTNEARP